MRTDTGQVFRLEDYRPSDWLIPRTSLTFPLDPDRTRVVAELTIERRDGVGRDDHGCHAAGDGRRQFGLDAVETGAEVDQPG